MKQLLAVMVVVASVAATTRAEATEVKVLQDEQGWRLEVDGKPMMIKGMNWGYTPKGENYAYSLWHQSDAFIVRVLDRDMKLLKRMGVNMIRQFSDTPPRWIEYIHDKYGIYTVIGNFMGRYGATIDGVWVAGIDYSNPKHRASLKADMIATIERYKNTRGVAMWVLGNENNYGLAWTGFEIGNLPAGEADKERAKHLYSLFGEAIAEIKKRDTKHPVAIANGDLQYVDLIAQYCKGLDVFGSNVYRGKSARDFFDVVKTKLGVPAMFTEFGADAYDAKNDREDAVSQAEYLRAQWQEIYEQSWGKGKAGTAIGGFVFQWVDGWWKSSQEERLDIHDTTATWATGAYAHDFVEGQNNMNEEWFGIAAIGKQDPDGFYEVEVRVAYDVLREAWKLDPYAEGTTSELISTHYGDITAEDYAGAYAGRKAAADVESMSKLRVSSLRLRFETNTTSSNDYSIRRDDPVFDHTESFFVDFTAEPIPRVKGVLSLNLVGNAAQNRLDPLYWENRHPAPDRSSVTGVAAAPDPTAPSDEEIDALERLSIYGATLEADLPLVKMESYYRVGHGHWGYDGDFFGLYREAYYGIAIDTYHAEAPFGMTLSGKRELSDFKLAFGPEIYWGANPTVIGKWTHKFGNFQVTAMHQEDVDERTGAVTSAATFTPLARRSTLSFEWPIGAFKLAAGGILAAPQQIGREYSFVKESDGMGYLNSGYDVFTGEIKFLDTLGARAKVTYDAGVARFNLEGNIRGLVADSGWDQTITWTGWSMKPGGRGNQVNANGGVLLTFGNFQVAPNVLYQRPLIGPNPKIDAVAMNNMIFPGVGPRNAIDDPFVVLENRETIGGELLFVWDPTPGTWFWMWDRDRREDAPFAFSLDAVYRHQPTSRDATLFIADDGNQYPAPEVPPAEDEWQTTFTWFSALPYRYRLSGTAYYGHAQSNAAETGRLVKRFGGSLKLVRDGFMASTDVRIKDFGPYDYHKDFNLTYPFQWYGDVSYGLPKTTLGFADTRLGLRGQFRTLDGFSEGYFENDGAGKTGVEGEVLTYVLVSL